METNQRKRYLLLLACSNACHYVTVRAVWQQQLFIRTVLGVNMKKILTTVVAVLVAVALVIVLKNQYGSIFAGKTYGMPALIEQGEVDHLFIGSSMFRQGLDIESLEDNLDGSVYILSYNGNQPVFMAKELEYLLKNGLQVETNIMEKLEALI